MKLQMLTLDNLTLFSGYKENVTCDCPDQIRKYLKTSVYCDNND